MKNKLKAFFCLVLLICLPGTSFGQENNEQILKKAVFNYFNSEPEVAIDEIDVLLNEAPNNLYYLDLRAAIMNDLTLNRTKRASKEEKLRLENAFQSYLAEAILIGEKELETRNGDYYRFFNLSSLYARKANFLHDKDRDSEAVDAIILSLNLAKESFKLNSDFQLPYGILGIAQYELGEIWAPFRFLGKFLYKYVRRLSREVRPDKIEGLRNLALATEYRGDDFRLIEAKWVLAEYLFKEKRYTQAYTLAKALSEHYPKNQDLKKLLSKCEAKLFLAVVINN